MKKKQPSKSIKVIDLFCGIGGLTHGFIKEGFTVVAGIDNDPTCRYGYEANNASEFVEKDIMKVTAEDLSHYYGKDRGLKILVGCAPCQPYSKLNLKKPGKNEFKPLEKFAELIVKIKPEIVSMENVKDLIKYPIFKQFKTTLEENGYKVSHQIVNTSDYGVPQNRKRLVLLASRLGEITLIDKTHVKNKIKVKDIFKGLEPIEDGEASKKDPLHRARKLSPLNKRRIMATPPDGGSTHSWNEELKLACHKKPSGKTYSGTVYGRMSWNKPAPTMTTQCIGLGNGRFGHPEQHRAISLREAALIQTFPKSYKFVEDENKIIINDVARFIGNAVPVKLGQVIAKSIRSHLAYYGK